MTLIQGAGVDWPGPRIVTYSRPPAANPPSPLKNSRPGWTRRPAVPGWRTRVLRVTVAALLGLWHTVELIGQGAALPYQNDPRHRQK